MAPGYAAPLAALAPDTATGNTSPMTLRFKWFGGATWLLDADGVRIGCDPVLCPRGHVQDYGFFTSERIQEPSGHRQELENADLWLITHEHEDHLDAEGLSLLTSARRVVCPRRASKVMARHDVPHHVLGWRQEAEWPIGALTVHVRAVPAIHSHNRLIGMLVGNANGYLLTIRGMRAAPFHIYVTGDDVFSAKRAREHLGVELDLVIANAGAAHVGTGLLGKALGRITNDSADLKRLAAAIRPRAMIAVHWGTFAHYLEAGPPPNDIPGLIDVAVGETLALT